MRMKQHRAVIEEFDWVLITSPEVEYWIEDSEVVAQALMRKLEPVRQRMVEEAGGEEKALRLLREGTAIEGDVAVGPERCRVVLTYNHEVDRPAIVMMHIDEVEESGLGEE